VRAERSGAGTGTRARWVGFVAELSEAERDAENPTPTNEQSINVNVDSSFKK